MGWSYDDLLALPADVYDVLIDVMQERFTARRKALESR